MLSIGGTTEKTLNILVAEDEPDTRQVISVLLTRPGHVVRAVSNGLEAMRSLEEQKYNILIADLKMPHLDGISVLRKAKELQPGLACIVLTGHSNREIAIEALELGVFDFIAKPFMIDQLLPAIDRISSGIKIAPRVQTKLLVRQDIPALVEHLMRQGALYAPVLKGNVHSFERILQAADAVLGYTSTVLPPKKIFLPTEEALLEYDRQEARARAASPDAPDTILWAVHACDMQAILRLDQIFLGEDPEPNYARRRRAAAIIGASCIPDDKCFCQVMGSHQTQEGFDIFLAGWRDELRVHILTDRGARLLSAFPALRQMDEASTTENERFELDSVPRQTDIGCNASSLPELLRLAQDDELWSKLADDCLSCGSCNLVCPTCHCFDVEDIPSLDGRTGSRSRRWDSCQLECFAVVAGGENFRKTRAERIHHRFAHKFSYFHEKTGMSMCVGCGRCARACPAGIGPASVLKQLCTNHRHSLLLRAFNFWH